MTDGIPARMTAVLLTAHGGIDALQYREDIPTPTPEGGEVLIRVAAAGVNNTEVPSRLRGSERPPLARQGTLVSHWAVVRPLTAFPAAMCRASLQMASHGLGR